MATRWGILVAVALLGCLAPGGPKEAPVAPADWASRVLSWPADHDHTDPRQHEGLTTPNFEIVGYDPLRSPYYGDTTPAGYLCGDAQPTADGRRLAVVESRSELGFAIADVTDGAHPKWLGEIVMRATYVYDVAMVPDGKHVVAVTSEVQQAGLAPPVRLAGRCGPQEIALDTGYLAPEDPLPRPSSLLLVDITDPTTPTIVDQRPLPGYGHSVSSTTLDGRTWILTSAVGAPGTDSFQFYELVDTPLGARLNLLSSFAPSIDAKQVSVDVGGHDDGVIAKHPLTGQTLAWLVDRRDLTIVDLADPRMPREVGRWSDWSPEREPFSGNLHSIAPLPVAWGDKHYTIVAPEWTAKPEQYPSGIVWVLDTTDPAAPVEVAAWTLPEEPEWTDYLHFSTHYLGVHERTLFVSMYHAGLWAVDLSRVGSEEFALLDSVGVFMPTNVSPAPPETPVRWTPTLEEALVQPNGDIVTFDSNSGLYVVRFDAARPAPAPTPWAIERP